METMVDYLRWRGDLTMEERPFNEVDNLILSKLIYFEFDTLPLRESMTLQDCARLLSARNQTEFPPNSAGPLLLACGNSPRFASVTVRNFRNVLDTKRQIQFAAATFRISPDRFFVAFRGTDQSIVGWREDFNLFFMEKTPAQSEAVSYLEEIMEKLPGKAILGGHSKGGNLAVYGGAFCKEELRSRIEQIYSNDGPGFNHHISDSPEYRAVLPKVQLIIPESSIIGIIFSYGMKRQIVKCRVDGGAQQHNPYTWLVERDRFLRAEQQTNSSQIMDETLNKWFASMSEEDRKVFVSTIFDALEASGAESLEELKENRWFSYQAIMKAAHTLNLDAKRSFRETVKKLALASREVLWDETRKHLPKITKK